MTRDNKNSVPHALALAFAVALVSGLLVSTTTVLLEPRYLANQVAEQRANLLTIARQQPGIEKLFEQIGADSIRAQLIELKTGAPVPSMDATSFDPVASSRDPDQSIDIPTELDLAGIKRRSKYARVYEIREDGRLQLIILPIYGKGYASTLHGFVGLKPDGNTIAAISFYQHEETPGMGGRVDNSRWLAQWEGKKIRNEAGDIRIAVGRPDSSQGETSALHHVDQLSGATYTSRGVENSLRYWMGSHGFGPFLKKLRN
ncbi:NADH:ubiquinone reductase (Na(+)-transporting) subunit C [Marinobacter sp. CHS3-4]|uniref:NADH:ubiquinone reductase (Na(+)-transporting) subunit C n=1 Tax=Marinobacter sp. CHS3-4 TaxID=3045174 RepID=UPI0024B6278D|nr:NADH:ubiquinone reductase (Na(+)-transporting) subunit C [Marinobacter sp. CHS3-4]MDI9245388.1 NADH:ubiquinone reductase (Na(+)-transporting) subunit C [Marinobacter sp. CHS3-4]